MSISDIQKSGAKSAAKTSLIVVRERIIGARN